jgi:hypothetical protein
VGNALELDVRVSQAGWKPLRLRVVGYDGADSVSLTLDGKLSCLPMALISWRMSGGELSTSISDCVCI